MISLRAKKLFKKFNQKTIFKELSFEHSEGVLGISGANGSGKSTLIKCLAFLLRPNNGSVEWLRDGKELEQREVKMCIGFAAPYINLYTELSVLENLRFLVEVGGIQADEQHLKKLLHRVQISHLEHQLFGSLSTGQQQRAKLASALLRNPGILLLDEPGSNLDKQGNELVSEIVKNAASNGTLVILASNNSEEIKLCDQVIELAVN
ncbi:MAG: ABC transporter ATP-binding protein [Balneolaceae bacterium]